MADLGGKAGFRDFGSESVVTSTSNVTVTTLDVRGLNVLYVEIQPVTEALTAFEIAARPNTQGTFNTLFSASGDFTSPDGLLIGASGDLTVLSAGSTGWFIMFCLGLDRVQLSATAAGAGTLTVIAGGQ